MPSASATQATANRLFLDVDSTLRCAEPGRGRGGRCNAAILKHDHVKCRGGHLHSIQELLAASAELPQLSGVSHVLVELGLHGVEAAQKMATKVISLFLSPPYSIAKAGDRDFYWPTDNPHRFYWFYQITRILALPVLERALQEAWILRNGFRQQEIKTAALKLFDDGDPFTQIELELMIESSIRSWMFPGCIASAFLERCLLVSAHDTLETECAWPDVLAQNELADAIRQRRHAVYYAPYDGSEILLQMRQFAGSPTEYSPMIDFIFALSTQYTVQILVAGRRLDETSHQHPDIVDAVKKALEKGFNGEWFKVVGSELMCNAHVMGSVTEHSINAMRMELLQLFGHI